MTRLRRSWLKLAAMAARLLVYTGQVILHFTFPVPAEKPHSLGEQLYSAVRRPIGAVGLRCAFWGHRLGVWATMRLGPET